MLAHAIVRGDPRDRGSFPARAAAKKGCSGAMFPSCPSCLHRREVRQRVPDPGRPRVLLGRIARHRAVVVAVGLGALGDVVAPAHLVLVQQVRDVGPRVARRLAASVAAEVGRLAGRLRRVPATRRDILDRAPRRPLADQEQVRGQAPRRVRLEHVVLEHEVARVRPVVRDLVGVVVAHHVDARRPSARSTGRCGRGSRACPRTAGRRSRPSLPPSMSRTR